MGLNQQRSRPQMRNQEPPLALRLAIVLPLLKGVFYKLVLMEILYLGLTWPLLQFSLASCCISKTHIARYARL